MSDKTQNPDNLADHNNTIAGDIHVDGSIEGSLIVGSNNVVGYTAEQVSVLIKDFSTTFKPKPFDGRSPYKGLDYFEEEDAELFFGREQLVDDLVGKVKESRTLFVTGPSGSGKSSLVRAGLIHALKGGCLKDSERWLYGIMKPGREPTAELARVTAKLAGTTNAEDEISAKAASDPTILRRWCEIALGDGKNERIVLFIDQFEEIFTQINKENANTFIDLLDNAVSMENSRVILLLAMRSDFISTCTLYPRLNALYNRQNIQIGGMQPEELASAIAQPALHVGLRIDPELIARIINDMREEPGALPLMQFALKDLFDAQQSQGGIIALTLNDYLQRGGIHKALERYADNSFNKLDSHEQELARSIFTGLIEIGRGTPDTRRTALFDELVPVGTQSEEIKSIVRGLADARLITTDEIAGKDTVTISHEKLIDAWPWLKRLVNENRDLIALQNQITDDAKEWESHGKDISYLYVGVRLANVHEQLEEKGLVINELGKEFIEKGTENYVNELKEAKKREEHLLQLTNIAVARQLSAQAQAMIANRSSKQMIAVLLAIQSMKMLPSSESAQILLSSNFAAQLITRFTHDREVRSVTFSPDGKYVVSGSRDNTARVWEISSGKEMARMIHNFGVTAVAFSPDSKHVVSSSQDKTARVWEAITGKEVSRMLHEATVDIVTFSPDGKYVASGSQDKTARVWNPATGEEFARMPHDSIVNSVAFSPNGKYIVTGDNRTARVWRTGASRAEDLNNFGNRLVSFGLSLMKSLRNVFRIISGMRVQRVKAASFQEVARISHTDRVQSVAFSPNSKLVISASGDGTILVWEATTGKKKVHITHGHNVAPNAIDSNGIHIVSGSADHTARIWDITTGREIARMTHDLDVTSVSFSPDGKWVVSTSYDNTARVWEAATGQEVARMTHEKAVVAAAFSKDGRYIVSGGQDKTVQMWRASLTRKVVCLAHGHVVTSLSFSPKGIYLATGSIDHTVRVWKVGTGEEIARMAHDSSVNSIAFSPVEGAKYVVSGSFDRTARVWNIETGKEIARTIHESSVDFVTFSPDGKYVVSGGSDVVWIWEATTGQKIGLLGEVQQRNSVAFSPDGKYIVAGSSEGVAIVLLVGTGEQISHSICDSEVNSAAFSPDGNYLVCGCSGTAFVFETKSGTEISRITLGSGGGDIHLTADGYLAELVFPDRITSVAFSPNGKYVVAGMERFLSTNDNFAVVWEAETGREISRMAHNGNVCSIAFSPDSNYVISGGDNTARVWEALTGKEVARMTHESSVKCVAFSPDGLHVASGSEDKTARIWIWRVEDLISDACSRLPRNLTQTEWQQYIGDVLPYQAVCENLQFPPETPSL
jgi:WD40 repeat protein